MNNRFEKSAGSYDAYAQVQREMADWLAEWIPVERSGSAIEIGAGTGFFTRHLLPWNGELTATDLSASMVETGKHKYPEVQWKVRDARELGPEPHDWIFSCSFLQWCDHPEKLLDAWRRRIAPGGKALCGFFIDGAIVEINRILGKDAPLPRRSGTEWEALFAGAGFRVLKMESRTTRVTYETSIDLFRRLHRIGATGTPRLTFPQMKALLGEYESTFGHPGGGVRATWKYCRLLAGR